MRLIVDALDVRPAGQLVEAPAPGQPEAAQPLAGGGLDRALLRHWQDPMRQTLDSSYPGSMTAHPHHSPPHHHDTEHDFDWAKLAGTSELEAEVLIDILDESLGLVVATGAAADGIDVRRVIDIGPGPGVGTGALAERFARADVIAVDGSDAMLSPGRRAGGATRAGRAGAHRARRTPGRPRRPRTGRRRVGVDGAASRR